MKLFVVCLGLLFVTLSAVADSHVIGKGGDALSLLFSDARVTAADATIHIRANFLPADLSLDLREWILKNKNELAADILRSPHVWIQNSQPKCAWTLIPPRLQEIVLSFETCQQTTLNDRHAAFVLIHESTHHFPELNSSRWSDAEIETRSDAIASAILAAAEAAVVKGTPVWKGLPLSKAPAPRAYHSANLVNSNTVSIFAGCEHERGVPFVCSSYFNDLALFHTDTFKWEKIEVSNSPTARAFHGSATFGDSLFVFGGCNASEGSLTCDNELKDAAIFDFKKREWKFIPTPPWLSARVSPSLFWTGKQILIWGGTQNFKSSTLSPQGVSDGALYDPTTNEWKKIAAPETLLGRYQPSITWTDDKTQKLIVWGGCDREVVFECNRYFNSGAILDAKSGRWSLVNDEDAPPPRRNHIAVWTGDDLVIWGGEWSATPVDHGARYSLKSNTWTEISNGPRGLSNPFATHISKGLLIWGGETFERGNTLSQEAWLLNHDGWSPLSTKTTPPGRTGATGVLTSEGYFVWGGIAQGDILLNTGSVLSVP